MTQEELGEVFGVKNTTVGGWEKNNSYPEFRILVEMRNYFGVNLESIVFSDLSAIGMPIVEESQEKYLHQGDRQALQDAQEKIRKLEEDITRLRGEIGKMGVMDARLQLLERQLELVMGEINAGRNG